MLFTGAEIGLVLFDLFVHLLIIQICFDRLIPCPTNIYDCSSFVDNTLDLCFLDLGIECRVMKLVDSGRVI